MVKPIRCFASSSLFSVLAVTLCFAQNPANSVTTAPATVTTSLQGAAQAFSKGVPVHGVTLTGTVNWIVGSDNESGNATLIAYADGSYQVNLELGHSSRMEAQTSFAQGQQCT